VVDGVDALEDALGEAADIGVDEFDAGFVGVVGEAPEHAVDDADLVAAGEELRDEDAADVASTAGDEDAHGASDRAMRGPHGGGWYGRCGIQDRSPYFSRR